MPMMTESLDRLFVIAEGDTGQGRRVANSLLAWWNARSCGGFDVTDLWNVDQAIARDMTTVFGAIGADVEPSYPVGFEDRFRGLVRRHRPELVAPERNGTAA